MLKSIFRILIFFVWGLSVTTITSAQPYSRVYLGAAVGQGEVEVIGHDRSQLIYQHLAQAGFQPTVAAGSEIDDTNSWKLYGGYRFKPWLAAELSYHDLGHTTGLFAANIHGFAARTQGKLRSEYKAISIVGISEWQFMNHLSLLAKVGIHHWQHQFNLNGELINISNKHSGNGLLYGAGIRFLLKQDLSLKLVWERLADIEDEDGIDTKTAALEWTF